MSYKRLIMGAMLFVIALALVACGGGAPQPVTINVKGGDDFKFDPGAITVKVGQAVTVNLTNGGALDHTFLIDELNVKIEVKPGQSGTATFTPSAAGTFVIYCNVPGHKEGGMVGTLTVTQ